ncbi:MAG: hypothetical protein ACKO15_03955 [Burkholderiales bacterium]
MSIAADRLVAASVPPPEALDMMNLHTERSSLTPRNHAAFRHIDLDEVQHFIGERPEVLVELLQLALSTSRDQISVVNRYGATGDAPAQRLAIHNLLNTFNFLRAKQAVATARRAECYVAASYAPLGPVMLTELNAVYDAIEAELSAFVSHPGTITPAV